MINLKEIIDKYDTILIGAGAGLSAAAGAKYDGKKFMDNFKYMYDLYGYTDMYSAGFHEFNTLEEKWAYWSKYIYINRYETDALDLYKRLFNLVKDKNYFVITTNVDHQFQKSNFAKDRLFYMQGDFGLFECTNNCKNITYDNKEYIFKMVNNIKDNKIPSSLIPKCPNCGSNLRTNLREDSNFVEDNGWHKAKNRYIDFIRNNKNKKILLLELGVGYLTPVWIKYPFINFTYNNKNALYITINDKDQFIPSEISKQTIKIIGNIDEYI